jgi:hypothetical protein
MLVYKNGMSPWGGFSSDDGMFRVPPIWGVFRNIGLVLANKGVFSITLPYLYEIFTALIESGCHA